ncbi:MAG: hypothetical protein AAGC72_15765 [Planctomycetota bacterium]
MMVGIDITPLIILMNFVFLGALSGGLIGAFLIDRQNQWHWLARGTTILGLVVLGIFVGYWAAHMYLATR